jgi:peptide/nickel transport system substrate-binding protein
MTRPDPRRQHRRASNARRTGTIAIATAIAMTVVGCTAPGSNDKGAALTEDGLIPVLQYGDFGGGTNPKENYNPFMEGQNLSAVGLIYERLMEINDYDCETHPWLATESNWVDDDTLTYTLRDGVKWNDGEAFDADDVVYTYNLLKEHPAFDTGGVWRYLDSVESTDGKTVTMEFNGPGASAYTGVNAVKIVPEHVWSEVDDPTTWVNAEAPVGTGPFELSEFNPARLTVTRNADYWQADKVKVAKIQFNKSDGGQVEQLKLARGDYDSNGSFIPDIENSYVAKDPEHNKYWFPAGSPVSLYMNLEKAPFSDLEFRQAIAQSVDRERITEEAQQGYVEVASQTGLVLPNNDEWLPDNLSDGGYVGYDAKAAGAALTKAGYVLDDEDRRLDLSGKPMQYTFKVPGDWADWVQAARVLQKNFEALGIGLDIQTPSPQVMEQDRRTGQYDFLFGVRGGTCNMYRNFHEPLASSQTAPTGEEALTNEVRWRDAKTDALIEELRVATDEATQKAAVGGLATIMVEQLPYIPLWYGANWSEYSTKNAVGWPDADNPYAKPSNVLLVVTNLEPATP